MARVVLLIDDDKLPMQYYTRAIKERKFEVCQYIEPDGALDALATEDTEIVAVILDIMMLPGKTDAEKDTNQGLKTGVFVLDTIKDRWPEIPVIVLTNVRNPDTLSDCRQRLGPSDRLFRKIDCPPFQLADALVAILAEKTKRQSHTEPERHFE